MKISLVTAQNKASRLIIGNLSVQGNSGTSLKWDTSGLTWDSGIQWDTNNRVDKQNVKIRPILGN